jgi:hypothetical protein
VLVIGLVGQRGRNLVQVKAAQVKPGQDSPGRTRSTRRATTRGARVGTVDQDQLQQPIGPATLHFGTASGVPGRQRVCRSRTPDQ